MNQMLINVSTRKFKRSVRLPEGEVPVFKEAATDYHHRDVPKLVIITREHHAFEGRALGDQQYTAARRPFRSRGSARWQSLVDSSEVNRLEPGSRGSVGNFV